ncbi:MAG: amidohydrolase [Saprospiraceae bacterium]|nr:amidohydrolase [Saprospiraceae bacterium]
MMRSIFLLTCALGTVALVAQVSPDKQAAIDLLESRRAEFADLALQIWDYAELGYMEEKSTAALQERLRTEGFSIESGVAGLPTGFVASYGEGKPVLGLISEFDALPGVSQAAVPYREERPGNNNGHACGHHLFGTGSAAAAIAVKDWLQRTGNPGTIRVYGTPAEEGGAGKVYMVREGLFDDVDAVLSWHAGDRNNVTARSCLAIVSVKFRFYGESAHAAGFPERGRSALDGVEAMNHMVNMMREHVSDKSRIHYVITHGGLAPNVVPAFAEVYYFVRHPDMREVAAIFDRMVAAAEGAALGTQTRMDYEITGGSYNVLPNETLAHVYYDNLVKVGGVQYDSVELAFAKAIMQTYPTGELVPEDAAKVLPLEISDQAGNYSTDAGDVSWVAPYISLRGATWTPGTASHSWQAVATGGTSIGIKGVMVAAKTIAMSAIDLFNNPALIQEAQDELQRRRGKDFRYEALLGDREPALDYMKK